MWPTCFLCHRSVRRLDIFLRTPSCDMSGRGTLDHTVDEISGGVVRNVGLLTLSLSLRGPRHALSKRRPAPHADAPSALPAGERTFPPALLRLLVAAGLWLRQHSVRNGVGCVGSEAVVAVLDGPETLQRPVLDGVEVEFLFAIVHGGWWWFEANLRTERIAYLRASNQPRERDSMSEMPEKSDQLPHMENTSACRGPST